MRCRRSKQDEFRNFLDKLVNEKTVIDLQASNNVRTVRTCHGLSRLSLTWILALQCIFKFRLFAAAIAVLRLVLHHLPPSPILSHSHEILTHNASAHFIVERLKRLPQSARS